MSAAISPADTKAGRLQRAVLELLRGPLHLGSDALPTSIRFLFYELEHAGLVTKDKGQGKRNDGQNLSDALMRLRELGLVPWEWIVDETRSLDMWPFSESVYEYVLSSVEDARIDCWAGEPPPVILTESRSLSGVLRRIAAEYLCPIAPTNGQVGGFLRTEVIPALHPGQRVLYLGDYDLAGGQIEANTRAVLEADVGPLRWERLAITAEQVASHDLTPIQKRDKRYVDGRPHLAYETEALGQIFIQDLLRHRLDALLPEPLADVRVREADQRAEFVRRLGRP
jgi:hypothetical protein